MNISVTEDGVWKATTSSFPDCKGLGQTESEAIDKLVTSITRCISKRTKQYLGKMLQSKHYTQVILDTTKTKKSHKRLFPLDGTFNHLSKLFFVKVKNLSHLNSEKPADLKPSDLSSMAFNQDETEFFSNTISVAPQGIEDGETMFVKRLMQGQADGGYVFGFPLSFN